MNCNRTPGGFYYIQVCNFSDNAELYAFKKKNSTDTQYNKHR